VYTFATGDRGLEPAPGTPAVSAQLSAGVPRPCCLGPPGTHWELHRSTCLSSDMAASVFVKVLA